MEFEEIRQTCVIDATPDDVYEAYVDPKKHAAFTGSPATGAAKVGGTFTAWDGYIKGKYLKLEGGKRIVHEWSTTEWPAGYPPSKVEILLKAKGGKTELTMVHSRAPAEQADDYAQGWRDFYWTPLKAYFEGKDEPRKPHRKAARK
ncbi:MAG TPA: SRPBCC domain-containing protein [Nitrososphaerales archaeon]|nr:SRPBCC domain-containing protein [Nitrososphaerales archaeon]